MRIEIINGQRVEYADEGKWLHDGAPDYTRYFTDIVYLGKDVEPWDECTDSEKISWEGSHPVPDPVPEPPESVEQPTE